MNNQNDVDKEKMFLELIEWFLYCQDWMYDKLETDILGTTWKIEHIVVGESANFHLYYRPYGHKSFVELTSHSRLAYIVLWLSKELPKLSF